MGRSLTTRSLYVLLEIYKLRNTYFSLLSRTKALRAAKAKVTPAEAEGYELQSTSEASSAKEVQVAEVVAIKQDWAVWKNAVLINSFVPFCSYRALLQRFFGDGS